MIRLGLRLTFASGREALLRLIAIAAGLALAVAMLLVTVAATNALESQGKRAAWLYSSPTNIEPSVDESKTDALWMRLSGDQYKDHVIGRIDLAATGTNSPVPPGIDRLPDNGEFYASPAMSRLLAAAPPSHLSDRYPGRQVGLIDTRGLPGPDSLVIVVGRSVDYMMQLEDARQIFSFDTSANAADRGGPSPYQSAGIRVVLTVVAVGLLVPVLIFIAATTRISAARRDQRLAAMRLVGATPPDCRSVGNRSTYSGIDRPDIGSLDIFRRQASAHTHSFY